MERSCQGVRQSLLNHQIFEKWVESSEKNRTSCVFRYLITYLPEDSPEHVYKNFYNFCHTYCSKLNKKWKECHRGKKLFTKKHETWLQSPVLLPSFEEIDDKPTENTSRGRPQKDFENCSNKTKRRRVAELVSNNAPEELAFAANISRNSTLLNEDCNKRLTPAQALALFVDLDLTDRKYIVLREVVNNLHKNCFPSLYALKQAKNKIIPKNISVSETSAMVDIQELVNSTVNGIVQTLRITKPAHAKLICKWGMDGSSGHSTYKQKFSNENETDEFLFLIAMVPIKLIDVETGETLWQNPRPGSTYFCRPIKFMFAKEDANLILNEQSAVESLISGLLHYDTSVGGIDLQVTFEFLFTMLDGKACSTLSHEKAAAKCYICGATPKEMNSSNVHNKPENCVNFRFGLSTLHCWIKTFECLLHIAYRLPFKTWQVRGEANKKSHEECKKRIQDQFKSQMGLIVDKPKPGFGTTNDGNTARRFFSYPSASAAITGIDANLIAKFSTILRIVSSGKQIDIKKYQVLLLETREQYLALYSWYYMPLTVHKLLIHSANIISMFDLPIGDLSEEALEATHKIIRKTRLNHTRKSSRVNSNEDLLRSLLLNSDPSISLKRKSSAFKHQKDDEELSQYFLSNCEAETFEKENLEDADNFSDDDINSEKED